VQNIKKLLNVLCKMIIRSNRGQNKQQKQIKNEKKAFIVKDNIEYAYKNVIPLWAFGLNY